LYELVGRGADAYRSPFCSLVSGRFGDARSEVDPIGWTGIGVT
jgi:hypothetical protein